MPSPEARALAAQNGFCTNCACRPAKIGRKNCADCIIKKSISGLFKHKQGSALLHGSCYVKGYNKGWIQQVMDRFNGKCTYTNAFIEIGGEETASVTLEIPRRLIPVYGESKILTPNNVVWVHSAVGRFKGELSRDDFLFLWNDLHISNAC
jgi:hypothetical protein